MRRTLAFSILLKAALSASGASAETLKVAVAQRGFWNSSFIEFGIKQGFFKETGLDIDILCTEGGRQAPGWAARQGFVQLLRSSTSLQYSTI
jgi:NitT/TauT family transport system substrate-binding protein